MKETQAQLEQLKREIEAHLGRPMDVGEEIETKALFYFSKGVQLKTQLEREEMGGPAHIREILPEVMANIRGRMKRQRAKQPRNRVVAAIRDFLGSGVEHSQYRNVGRQKKEQGRLW